MEKRRAGQRTARPIGEVLAELAASSSFARTFAVARWEAAWRQVVGETIAAKSQVSLPRRGVLTVLVANSAVLHELQFRKAEILRRLASLMPEQPLKDVRFRVGSLG